MPVYEIAASDSDGKIVVVAATDTATEALNKFRAALGRFSRAWVTDESGVDVDLEELSLRAGAETGN